jgi:hypothetical protein
MVTVSAERIRVKWRVHENLHYFLIAAHIEDVYKY